VKNRMADVRNHLVAMLEILGDPKCKPEMVERAKATSLVANSYIAAVKVEIDAYRAAELMQLPESIGEGQRMPLRALEGGRK
jgi:hypothetical protein